MPPPHETCTTKHRLADDFAHIDTWVFDLDNTLYAATTALWQQIDMRITTWIANFYGTDGLSARALQKYYFQNYGTSMRGMMLHDDLEPVDFMNFVHDIDHSALAPAPGLGRALAALPGRKFIFTSGTRKHAFNVVKRLDIAEHFEAVFDIVDAGYLPKPASETYQRFFERHAIDPARAAMFEDIAHNLVVPHARGMRTILIIPHPAGSNPDHNRKHDTHINYETDNITDFISALGRGLMAVPDISNS